MIWNDGGLVIFFGRNVVQIDRLTVVVFLIAFVGFSLFAFLVLKFLQRRKSKTCRWKRATENTRPPFTKWQCKICVAEAYTTDKRPPKECKKILKTTV